MPDLSPLGARLLPTTPELSEYVRNEFPREDPAFIWARGRRPEGPDGRPGAGPRGFRSLFRRAREVLLPARPVRAASCT